MRSSLLTAGLLAIPTSIASAPEPQAVPRNDIVKRAEKISPKFFIISMFSPEAEVWYGIPEFNLLEHNITILGLSPLFPDAHCTSDGQICQVVTGEGGK